MGSSFSYFSPPPYYFGLLFLFDHDFDALLCFEITFGFYFVSTFALCFASKSVSDFDFVCDSVYKCSFYFAFTSESAFYFVCDFAFIYYLIFASSYTPLLSLSSFDSDFYYFPSFASSFTYAYIFACTLTFTLINSYKLTYNLTILTFILSPYFVLILLGLHTWNYLLQIPQHWSFHPNFCLQPWFFVIHIFLFY